MERQTDPFVDDGEKIADTSILAREGEMTGTSRRSRKPVIAVCVILACAVAVIIGIYAHGVSKYATHLFPNTTIDGMNIGDMTVDEADAVLDTSDWHLTIDDVDGTATELDAEQVGLEVSGDTPQELLDRQNPYEWLAHLNVANATSQRSVEFDEDKVRESIQSLDMVNADKRENPVDATFSHDGDWGIIPEVEGNLVDADKLANTVISSIDGLNEPTVQVTDDMLVKPSVTSDDATLRQAVSDANKWSHASVTYDIDDQDSAEMLGSDTIASWVSIVENNDKTFSAVLDESAVKAWCSQIGDKYDTNGEQITITSPAGRTVAVPGTEKNTGWVTDEATETSKLIETIKNGEQDHREFAMKQRASNKTGADIWGTTYIEVDLTTQHLWYIKDGQVQQDFGVISGKSGYDTPTGVTKVYKKVTDTTLISPWKDENGEPTYKSHIDVGLVISSDGGILIHNAPWQPSSMFGNAMYHRSGGSHGCVNAPTAQCWTLYNTVLVGTPVIVHD